MDSGVTSGQVLVAGTGINSWSAPLTTISNSGVITSGSNMITVNGTQYMPLQQTYAWDGFNFFLYSLGFAVIVLVSMAAYHMHKSHNPTKTVRKR
jgi:hypothetical protein